MVWLTRATGCSAKATQPAGSRSWRTRARDPSSWRPWGWAAALASRSGAGGLVGLCIAGAVSRLTTLWIGALVPYVRETGLGVAAWEPSHRATDLVIGTACAALDRKS